MKTPISILLACLVLFATNKNGFVSGFPFFAKPPIEGEAQAPKYQLLYPTPIIPLSKTGQAPRSSPGPAPQLNEDQQKCIQLFHDTGTGSCLRDLGNSYQTQQIRVSRPCCDAVQDLDEECKSVVHFHNSLFQKSVQRHCSGGPGAKVGSMKVSWFGFGSPATPTPTPTPAPEVGSPTGAKAGNRGPSWFFN